MKIEYSPTLQRIRVVFTAGFCVEQSEPPAVYIQRTRAKFAAEKKEGKVGVFVVYDDTLRKLWQVVRQDVENGGDENARVAFTLGAAAPLIDKVSIQKVDAEKMAFTITFGASGPEVANWKFEWLVLNIENQMKSLGIKERYNRAQLFSCWMRAKRYEKIESVPIMTVPTASEKPYSVVANRGRSEVTVIINQASALRDKAQVSQIIKAAQVSCRKLSFTTGVSLEFLKENLLERLKDAIKGAESYGVNLPAVFLAGFPEVATNLQGVGTPDAAAAPRPDAPPPATADASASAEEGAALNYKGTGKINFEVDENKMEVLITDFDTALYDDGSITLNVNFIKKELKAHGFRRKMDKKVEASLAAAISKGNDLDEIIVLQGKHPKPGKGPFLHPSYMDSELDEKSDEVVDLRDHQQRRVVQPGDLVAEIRYSVAPEHGVDVFGEKVIAGAEGNFNVVLGDGVEDREDGKFYATNEGMPIVEGTNVSLSAVFIQEGDVNLRSGNIYFNGNAEIRGAIDSGATVEVTGDLVVHGTIRDAFIRVGGNIEAKSGIVTGPKGRVQCRNDIMADFIENSNIVAGGNVLVRKALLNSKVVAGGSIETNEKRGVIAGGRVSCRKYIKTADFGFPKGAITQAFVGVDWRAKVAIDIRSARLENMLQKNQDDRTALRELSRRKAKTKKHVEQAEKIKLSLQKQRDLIEKMRVHLRNAEETMSFDRDARVFIHNILYNNCEFELAGTNVPVMNEVAEVMITPKRYKGSFIRPLDAEEEEHSRAG